MKKGTCVTYGHLGYATLVLIMLAGLYQIGVIIFTDAQRAGCYAYSHYLYGQVDSDGLHYPVWRWKRCDEVIK